MCKVKIRFIMQEGRLRSGLSLIYRTWLKIVFSIYIEDIRIKFKVGTITQILKLN